MLNKRIQGRMFRVGAIALLGFARHLNGGSLTAQEVDNQPISYVTATPDNPVSQLQAKLDQGEVTLKYDDRLGYLKALLKAFNVPVSSQSLVFSKTSLQREQIGPRTPRAIYFSDDMYIGYCQGGNAMEISAVDPRLGAVFYTLNQERAERPQMTRQFDNCLMCHSSSHTHFLPGHFVRSVYVGEAGYPLPGTEMYRIDQRSPISNRWGGWYVTGSHGNQSHLGNLIVKDKYRREPYDNTAGQNVADLKSRIETDAYLSPHSDLVALMVMEHQMEAQNLITRANMRTRQALYDDRQLRKEIDERLEIGRESATTTIQNACEELVRYLLFSGEAQLTAKIAGTSSFADDFAHREPHDSQGRSLREFDLEHRLFKYPCSYLVYSQAIDSLPRQAWDQIMKRLYEVLSGSDQSKPFAHLTTKDRSAILEILRETKLNLPDYWHPEPVR